ncbi:hypothetical protein AX15_001331 [Amanita polypyramis BW_CC]|nr:hypothetical protein AX15_001331 [Amanita polypyramis BW_CC]
MAGASPPNDNADAKEANRARFELELEFVQALANPFYLHSLAQQNILEQPAFINYLKYLLYFKEKDYARFIHYPHALHHLELLQHAQFRARLKNDEFFREYLHQKQFDHWRTWLWRLHHFVPMALTSFAGVILPVYRLQGPILGRQRTELMPLAEDRRGHLLYNCLVCTYHSGIVARMPKPRPASLDEGAGSTSTYEEPLLGVNTHLATLKEKQRLWWKIALINALFISSWFFFATIISVYNKWMFSSQHFGFPAPLFVTTMHMFMQFLLAAAIRFLWPKHFRPKVDPTPSDYGKKALPTAVTTSLDIGFSNLSLKMITLSFYTMCKSSSLIFVLLFAFLFRLEFFSWRLVAVIFLIFSGVILMVATETHFVLSGFILVISASALGGLRWSLTQVLLRDKMGFNNPASTIFWLAPAMGITLTIISLFVEHWGELFKSKFFSTAGATMETSLYLVIPGVLAFCMVLSEFYIIQRTGVVPMSIAGIAKEVTTISISAWIFGDELTPLNIVGVGITVCGAKIVASRLRQHSQCLTLPYSRHRLVHLS